MMMKVATLVAMLVTLSACSANYAAGKGPFAGYPYRHTISGYKVGWKTAQTDGGVVVDGILKNERYPYAEDVILTGWLYDKENRVIDKDIDYPIPQPIRDYGYRPFSLKFRNAALSQGDAIQLLI